MNMGFFIGVAIAFAAGTVVGVVGTVLYLYIEAMSNWH